jgi:hypothetical protein
VVEPPLTGWVGPTNHIENIHYDDDDNLHLILKGRKLWLIYPPSQSTNLLFYSLLPLLWNFMKFGHDGAPFMRNGIGGDPATTNIE